MIAWLPESMSRRNPSSRRVSSRNVEEKTLLSFASCSTPWKVLYISRRHLKPTSLDKDSHQVLEPKKISTQEVTGIAYRRIEHHPFRHCRSRFFTSGDDLQCTLYSTLCRAGFQRKFLRITTRSQYDTVPYRATCMISRERVSCPGTAIGQIRAAVDAVQCAFGDIRHISLHDLRSQDYKNIILASGSNCFPKAEGFLPIR